MSKIQTKKSSFFFMIPIPKLILKKCLRPIRYFKFKEFHWLTHDDMEFELNLKGPFWVEISSNVTKKLGKHAGMCMVD